MSSAATKQARGKGRPRQGLAEGGGAQDLLRVVVAADPQAALFHGREASLVKAALLYGDRVIVLSPVTGMLVHMNELRNRGAARQIRLLQGAAPYLTSGPKTSQLRRGLALAAASLGKSPNCRNPADHVFRRELLEQLDSATKALGAMVEQHLSAAGIDGLAQARAQGLVEYDSGATGDGLELLASSVGVALLEEGRPLEGAHEARVVDAFATRLSRHLAMDSGWLLLDEQVASLVAPRWGCRWSVWGVLPSFGEATLDDVLGIHARLSGPIGAVRRALASLSGQFADGPEAPSAEELRDAWRSTAQPALDEITEAARDDDTFSSVGAGICGTTGEMSPGVVIIGPATGRETDLRNRDGGRQAASPGLIAAWRRRGASRGVRAPLFSLMCPTTSARD